MISDLNRRTTFVILWPVSCICYWKSVTWCPLRSDTTDFRPTSDDVSLPPGSERSTPVDSNLTSHQSTLVSTPPTPPILNNPSHVLVPPPHATLSKSLDDFPGKLETLPMTKDMRTFLWSSPTPFLGSLSLSGLLRTWVYLDPYQT